MVELKRRVRGTAAKRSLLQNRKCRRSHSRQRILTRVPVSGKRQNPFISTKKGLSEHYCFKKRYSDSFYFIKRRDAMKSVLFSYVIHYPFLFAFRWGYRRISQRICQRHGKIARKHFIYKVTVTPF